MERRGFLQRAATTAVGASVLGALGRFASAPAQPTAAGGIVVTRISADRHSPHWHPTLSMTRVFVDDVEIHNVIDADAANGWVRAMWSHRAADGRWSPELKHATQPGAEGFREHVFRGRVRLEWEGPDVAWAHARATRREVDRVAAETGDMA